MARDWERDERRDGRRDWERDDKRGSRRESSDNLKKRSHEDGRRKEESSGRFSKIKDVRLDGSDRGIAFSFPKKKRK